MIKSIANLEKVKTFGNETTLTKLLNNEPNTRKKTNSGHKLFKHFVFEKLRFNNITQFNSRFFYKYSHENYYLYFYDKALNHYND